jgi:uncharacterized protein
MRIRLRNLLAEWCLAALRDARGSTPLRALAAFAERTDETGRAEGMATEQMAILASTGCFETDGVGVLLAPHLRHDLPALRARVPLLIDASAKSRARCGDPTTRDGLASWSLCAAAALFNTGLFFEVHELLESDWHRATGDLKTILQGLIQVAVGLHHQTEGNIRGALTRLSAGNERLRRFRPAAQGIDLEGFCTAVERIVTRLRLTPGVPIEAPRLVVRQPFSENKR